jgi:hypothetical protein
MTDLVIVKATLEKEIDEAWHIFNQIATEEEEDGYSDAMQSMERTEANGFAVGLERAYYILFNERYISEAN